MSPDTSNPVSGEHPRLWAALGNFVGGIRRALCFVAAIAGVHAVPVFLDTCWSGSSRIQVLVYAGAKTEFVLTLAAGEVVQPKLRAGLFAVNDTLAAPLDSEVEPELHRQGSRESGVQRFSFVLEVPAVERRQSLLLKLRVQTGEGAAWLALPPVPLEAELSTWQESLRQFAGHHAVGRVNGGDRLAAAFAKARIVPAEAEAEPDALSVNPAIRVWFAETDEDSAPLVPAPGALVIVFKPDLRDDLELARTGPTLTIRVRAGVLKDLDRDPAAQRTFERALTTAAALLADPASSP